MTITLSYPLHGNYPITQIFGETTIDYSRYGLIGHAGIDWGCPENTPVYASDAGKITKAEYERDGYGNHIVVSTDWGRYIVAHLNKMTIAINQKINKGDLLGYSGSTGFSTAAHLHFEIKPNGIDKDNGYKGAVNPMPYLTGSDPSTPPQNIAINPGDTVTVTADPWLWVRDAPTTEGDRVSKLMPGDQVKVLEVVEENGNKWGMISVYIALEYDGEMLVTK